MRPKLFLFTFLSAALLTAAWPPWGFTPLLFIAFIPLFYVQHIISGDNRLRARHLFVYGFIGFATWNALTTWWIFYASGFGAVMAVLVNTVLMSSVLLIFHKIKRVLPERLGTFVFIPLWITFEYIHHSWDISWPWLTLGNAFGNSYKLIQWYEFTGTFGGSFWVLIVNVLLFEIMKHRNTLLRPMKVRLIYISSAFIILSVPVICSLVRYHTIDLEANRKNSINVVVVQPNIDPYKKFDIDFRATTESMLALAESKIDSTTDYVVFPETSLVESIWEKRWPFTWTGQRIKIFLKNYPKLKFVSGASTGYEYLPGEERSATTRKFEHEDIYFESYNTALQTDCTGTVAFYHKSKLVPGVEKMPFPEVLGFLEDFAIDLGGTSGSLGMQKERTVFVSSSGTGKVAPVICYESIYGDYVGQYIRNGAEFIFIVTNDGWWQDTPGYKQHLVYGRLRAIETRKSIARSANTGISCFVNKRGDIDQPQPWNTAVAIKQTLTSNEGMTFYTRHGDLIAIAMLWLSIAAVLFSFFKFVKRRITRKKTL
ncbi:MAG: apolipoprotein N-acyltransferase [Bacteroidota bacterium]|nr:apolipoprotein N-acyltransferase [Bacteroidota bacterium]